ncbi:MAG: DUF3108 domain-containing protein [Candidatus Marinimicrobia bacterium]|nr:DUF3108 domain-containing protein [Candidatus Neomarinimicrobiota bacterium]
MKKFLLLKLLITSTLISPISLFSSIVDTPLANLTEAQKSWLLNQRETAKILYIEEINSSEQKEVSAHNAAFLYFLEGKYMDADLYINVSLKNNHKYGPTLLLKGMIEYKRRNLKNSFKYLKAAIKHHSNSEIPEYYLGLYLYERKKYEESLDYLKDAISDNKKFTLPYPIIGDIYIKQCKYNEAIKILEKGLKYSYDAEILLLLADVNIKTENYKEAEKYNGIFAYLFPNHPETSRVIKWIQERNIGNPYTHDFYPIPYRDSSNRFFPIGENVLYNVHWGPIKVGELNTVIAETLSFKGHDAYKVIFSLDSNPALEFIASLHSDYITIINQNTKQVLQHFLHLRENKIICEKVYDFYREEGKFICRAVREDGHIEYLEKYLPNNTIDATSILFYSRQLVKEQRNERVMTIIDENFVISDIIFENKREPVICRGKEELVQLISGENYYKGIVGFTGKFRGWLRGAPAYLPIKSDFEIWVGRISIIIASEEEQKLHKYSR